MEGHNYEHQATRCVYQQPLLNNPGFVIPKVLNTQGAHLPNTRLLKLEDMVFEHEKIKSMLKNDGKKCGDGLVSLWSVYSLITPSYARFGINAKKSNFANVLMPINGVNITLGSKFSSRAPDNGRRALPLTPDSIRFDSHFESGNLLYAYRR
jgi:hypothetical protein